MNVILDNKELPLEIMGTPNAISTGMMGRDNLEGGMLFIFPEIGERSFWMKDCLIPLDIIFIIDNKLLKFIEIVHHVMKINVSLTLESGIWF